MQLLSWNGVVTQQFGKHRTQFQLYISQCVNKNLRTCSFRCTSKQNFGGFYCCGNFFDMCCMRDIEYWPTNSCPITWQTQLTRCWPTPLWVCITEWSYSHSHLDERWSVHLLQNLQFMTEIIKEQMSSSNELPGKYF